MLSKIKRFVEDSIRRRSADILPGASDVWQLGIELISYVRQLDEHELKYLRRHTYHFTGDNYQRYLFGTRADLARLLEQRRALLDRLPRLELDEGPNGIGYDTEFGRISADLIRYLSGLSDLVASGALRPTDRKAVLEIGGGYGGLARTTLSFAPGCAYVICDLEEMLFFSAVYLSSMFGAERVHLVEGGIDREALESGHFYLVPQIDIERLCGRFELALNQSSMQEMETRQVERYCDFLGSHAEFFYSRNLTSTAETHVADFLDRFDLVKQLNEKLRRRFTLLWTGRPGKVDVADENQPHVERMLLRCRT